MPGANVPEEVIDAPARRPDGTFLNYGGHKFRGAKHKLSIELLREIEGRQAEGVNINPLLVCIEVMNDSSVKPMTRIAAAKTLAQVLFPRSLQISRDDDPNVHLKAKQMIVTLQQMFPPSPAPEQLPLAPLKLIEDHEATNATPSGFTPYS
jgi:hypothetical protein